MSDTISGAFSEGARAQLATEQAVTGIMDTRESRQYLPQLHADAAKESENRVKESTLKLQEHMQSFQDNKYVREDARDFFTKNPNATIEDASEYATKKAYGRGDATGAAKLQKITEEARKQKELASEHEYKAAERFGDRGRSLLKQINTPEQAQKLIAAVEPNLGRMSKTEQLMFNQFKDAVASGQPWEETKKAFLDLEGPWGNTTQALKNKHEETLAKREENREKEAARRDARLLAVLASKEAKQQAKGGEDTAKALLKMGAPAREVGRQFFGDEENADEKIAATLGGIDATEKKQLFAASSVLKNTENIAKFITENPKAVGSFAAAAVAVGKKTLNAQDNMEHILGNKNTPEEAIILAKKLNSLALEDAASTGRMSVYLERLFKSIYDQSVSPRTLIHLLKDRQEEAEHKLSGYGLPTEKLKQKKEYRLYNSKDAGSFLDENKKSKDDSTKGYAQEDVSDARSQYRRNK